MPYPILTGWGSRMVVAPLYVHSSGSDATVGRMSLYRQGRSSTSSAKPSRTMKQMDKRAALYDASCREVQDTKLSGTVLALDGSLTGSS